MTFKLKLSENNPNTLENIELAFQPNGTWEKNNGREQTRIFAKCFHKHIKVPLEGDFSVLDVGCALGDALPIWKKYYPNSRLFGCDISETAIKRAKAFYGSIANFFVSSFENIEEDYDVIYCSNVIEHFEQYYEITEYLLNHCKILYILTPFVELHNGRPLSPSLGYHHVTTIYEDTFDEFEKSHNVLIKKKVVKCPKAWSPSFFSEAIWHFRYLFGMIYSASPPNRQIIFSFIKR